MVSTQSFYIRHNLRLHGDGKDKNMGDNVREMRAARIWRNAQTMCIFSTSTLTVAEFNITRVSSKELYLVFIVGGSEVIKLLKSGASTHKNSCNFRSTLLAETRRDMAINPELKITGEEIESEQGTILKSD